jgi:hypothetical protein
MVGARTEGKEREAYSPERRQWTAVSTRWWERGQKEKKERLIHLFEVKQRMRLDE